jgi:CheY-like chemotaxis protein
MTLENDAIFDILLLEDEPADAYLIRMIFKTNKFRARLHHALDGQEGLEFLRREGSHAHAPRPDLILLDINMPRMNGREFLAAVKADPEFADIPAVVLTTSEAQRDIAMSYRLGAAGYVTKPADMEQFAAAIEKLGAYWLSLVRLPHPK